MKREKKLVPWLVALSSGCLLVASGVVAAYSAEVARSGSSASYMVASASASTEPSMAVSSTGSSALSASTSESLTPSTMTDVVLYTPVSGLGSTSDSAAKDNAPVVTTLDDGTMVQRTPSENISATQDATPSYNHPIKNVPYNTYYLKADTRGCNSCHDDLAALLDAMPYGHVSLTNDLGIDITVQMCLDCHSAGPGYQTIEYSFGSIIHGIHSTTDAQCWNCHDATNDGNGMQLWDVVKHKELRGITDVTDVQGDFTYNQDETIPQSSLYNFDWESLDLDYLRAKNTTDNVPLDQTMFDNWTITVSGDVDNVVTYSLKDLIAEVPSVTEDITMHCIYNPTGGPLIGNMKVTGIPLRYLLNQAGIKDDAGSFYAASPDGQENAMELSTFKDQEALIVYQIDGEPLSWANGYPCTLFVGGTGAGVDNKELSDIIVLPNSDTDHLESEGEGWEKGDGGYYNKPNVGFENVKEGQVIEAGKPFTFEGYASSWDENVDYIEFSMDKGVTWTRCDVSDTNRTCWIKWTYTWTPDADVETAYVMRVRAVTESGLTTEEPPEIMVNTRTAADMTGE